MYLQFTIILNITLVILGCRMSPMQYTLSKKALVRLSLLYTPTHHPLSFQSESPGGKTKPGGVETTSTPERKRRRKSKIEPLDINEIEAGKSGAD